MVGQKLWDTEGQTRQVSLTLISFANDRALPDESVQLPAFCQGGVGEGRLGAGGGGVVLGLPYLSLHDGGSCS